MPVGTKTYNNYSVVASTGDELYTNKEQIYLVFDYPSYVDTKELFSVIIFDL